MLWIVWFSSPNAVEDIDEDKEQGDKETHPARHHLRLDQEAHPAHNHEHEGGQIHLEQVELSSDRSEYCCNDGLVILLIFCKSSTNKYKFVKFLRSELFRVSIVNKYWVMGAGARSCTKSDIDGKTW